jgi:hypothetical protein
VNSHGSTGPRLGSKRSQLLAQVLGTTPGAAKMLIHQTLRQLRGRHPDRGPDAGMAADLEAVIDEVLARGHVTIGDEQLRGMLLSLAAIHQPDVPDDLSSHVATCVQCAVENEVRDDPPPAGRVASSRGRFANGLAAITAFMGICLVCTVPALQTLTLALGVGMAGYVLHLAGVAGAPLVAWMVHRGTRRHRRDRAYRLARAGAIAMAGHAVMHVLFEILAATPVPAWLEAVGTVAFASTDWVATALLVAGATLNLVETQRWRRAQTAGLEAIVRPMAA